MSATMLDSVIFGGLWSKRAIHEVFDELARTRGWLEIVAVLGEVQAEYGLIPAQAARDIAALCRSVPIDPAFLDEVRLGREQSGHSTQGLIRALQARLPPNAAQWVYANATVQDVTDTWLMQTLSHARAHLVADVAIVEQGLVDLARRHRDTPMAGRTHGQQGLPITFGFKAAGWLAEMRRNRQRLVAIASRMDIVQLAGGVGSLSQLGPNALDVQSRFAARLGLRSPVISWTSSRDCLTEWCQLLTLITGTADRIGHEVYNLQRSEIGEVREGVAPGVVGSITMPHKRNPEIAEHLGTLARLVRHLGAAVAEGLVHDHERDGRSWKTEWVTIPEATLMAGRAVELLGAMLGSLEIDAARMRANLDAQGGFVLSEAIMLALAPHLGRDAAHTLVFDTANTARQSGQSLIAAVRANPAITAVLPVASLDALLDPAAHTGQCGAMVDRVLAEDQG